jgi:peroxiredoxin Q/BCP
MSDLQVGKKAPSFKGLNSDEDKVNLKDLLGENGAILYFYPRDSTPGCTTEACDFRDNLERLQGHGYTVIGISKDSVKSHQKFIEKNNLNFQLISDEDGSICDKYGVFGEKKFMGKTVMGIKRTTFILDNALKIKKIYNNVKVKGHIDQILIDIKES